MEALVINSPNFNADAEGEEYGKRFNEDFLR
jgi:hypothetical protein